MKCTALPAATALSTAAQMAGFSKNSPSRIDLVTRVKSWYTTRPAPRFMWPTSELPIWPSGRPTSIPEPEINQLGTVAVRRSSTGFLAEYTALSWWLSLCPKPSRIIRTKGLGVVVIDPLAAVIKEGNLKGSSSLKRSSDHVTALRGLAPPDGCVYLPPF